MISHSNDTPLLAAIRYMIDYLRDGKYHSPITGWYWGKARQILMVGAQRHGWRMTSHWPGRLIEIGLAAEELGVMDELRWSVARELLDDVSVRCFTIAEFKRRLALAQVAKAQAGIEPQRQTDEPSARHQFLTKLGFELE
jgi:hypothetical protein